MKTDYNKSIMVALSKFNPNFYGGCFLATRWLCEKHPELREKIIKIKTKHGDVRHCIAITPENKIIDTQHLQFSLLMELDTKYKKTFTFTQAEHEAYLPR